MRRMIYLIITLILVISVVGCSSNTNNSGPTITEVEVPNRVSTNASYMITIDTDEEDVDVEISTEHGNIVKKDSYGEKIEWQIGDYETEASLKIMATSTDGTTTMNKDIDIVEPPIIPIDYDIWTDSIGSKFVDITFQNNSGKKIIAIDLNIIGWNNFNERIPTDYLGEDYILNATASDVSIDPGASSTHTWGYLDIEFINPVTKVKAYVTRVAYDDGTSWELN